MVVVARSRPVITSVVVIIDSTAVGCGGALVLLAVVIGSIAWIVTIVVTREGGAHRVYKRRIRTTERARKQRSDAETESRTVHPYPLLSSAKQ